MATRVWAAGQVALRLTAPLAAVQMGSTDVTGELKEPIDDALRMLGYAESALASAEPDDAESLGFMYLVTYATLKAIWRKLATRFDISSQGDSLKLSQITGNVERMLKAAEADVIRFYGAVPSGGSDDGGVVTLDLNYLSPPAGIVSRDYPYTVIGVGDG